MTEDKKPVVPVGPVIRGEVFLHGKKTKLIRGGKEVNGTVESQSGQKSNDKLVFKWKDENGKNCISSLTWEELEKIKTEKIIK